MYLVFRMTGLDKRLKPVLIGMLIPMLLSCSSERGQESLDNYLSRLQNVFADFRLDNGQTDYSNSDLGLSRSSPKSALQPLAETQARENIDLLDFLSLYGCRLQEVVANANSSLGKVASSSQQLISSLRFLALSPECIAQMRALEKDTLAKILESARLQKQTQLDYQIAKVIFEGPEYRAFWRKPAELENYPEQLSGEPIRALARLGVLRNVWKEGNYEADLEQLETLLFSISLGDGGALIKAYEQLVEGLIKANALLRSVLGSETLCQNQTPYSKDVLSNVVQKFFIGDVQVWASGLNRRRYEIEEVVKPLENEFVAFLSDEYRAWQSQRERLLEAAQSAVKKHVAALKILMEPAELSGWCEQRGAS